MVDFFLYSVFFRKFLKIVVDLLYFIALVRGDICNIENVKLFIKRRSN